VGDELSLRIAKAEVVVRAGVAQISGNNVRFDIHVLFQFDSLLLY
jgi:hypothetical protein